MIGGQFVVVRVGVHQLSDRRRSRVTRMAYRRRSRRCRRLTYKNDVRLHRYICLRGIWAEEAWKKACNHTYLNKRGSVYDE
jgi:hypothetical protein